MNNKIGFGGGCHWCTEGVFQSLKGIVEVKQGWIASDNENKTFSEGVLVEFIPEQITLQDLIEIHLHTHACTSSHSFRVKYRSAVYVFNPSQKKDCEAIIADFQPDFESKIITQVLYFKEFKLNRDDQLNYLYTRTNNAFCQNYIHPKLRVLLSKFSNRVNTEKISKLKSHQVKL